MHSGGAAAARKSWPDPAIVVSRLLAAVAAALVVGAVVRAVAWDGVASHPRNWFVAVVFTLVGVRVVAHARTNAVGWTMLATGVSCAAAVGAEAWPGVWFAAWVGTWLWWPGYSLLPVVLLLFPDGRPLSRWWWPALVFALAGVVLPAVGFGWASWSAPATFWQDAVHGAARRGVPLVVAVGGFLCFVVGLVGGLVSLVVRALRASGAERRLLCAAIIGGVVAVVAFVLEVVASLDGAWLAMAAAFPAAAVVAILRYGLYDIDLVIHRTFLYGLLASSLIGGYVVTVLAAAEVVMPGTAHVVGTVAVVLAVAPLHRALLRGLNRLLYGNRADPYRVLSDLGRRLEHPLHPDAVFQTVARSVAEALKLPYVAIHLETRDDFEVVARHGRARGRSRVRLPMVVSGRRVGELVAEARSPEERLSRLDTKLLADVARQAAPAAESARLARQLRQADEHFEQEREEDLKRIIRDLHDAIGPSVFGIRLLVKAALQEVDRGSPLGGRLSQVLDRLDALQSEVRAVVRSARPRDLDHGLVEAVRRQAERFTREFDVEVVADPGVDGLPDRVGLTVYWIVSEALNNVARHARASSCRIRISRTPELELVVTDDGRGVRPDQALSGGLATMRERCTEIGGTFTVEPASPGTRIVARLPVEPH